MSKIYVKYGKYKHLIGKNPKKIIMRLGTLGYYNKIEDGTEGSISVKAPKGETITLSESDKEMFNSSGGGYFGPGVTVNLSDGGSIRNYRHGTSLDTPILCLSGRDSLEDLINNKRDGADTAIWFEEGYLSTFAKMLPVDAYPFLYQVEYHEYLKPHPIKSKLNKFKHEREMRIFYMGEIGVEYGHLEIPFKSDWMNIERF